jgi:hypothetical protein
MSAAGNASRNGEFESMLGMLSSHRDVRGDGDDEQRSRIRSVVVVELMGAAPD